MTKFLNISTDNTLGGNSPSDVLVSSQKAVKEYVDNHGGGGGSVAIDDITITENSSQEIQAVAVVDQNTGIAKTWTGTMAEYDAIVTKDPETEYIITDDIGGSATEIGEITEALNNKVDKGHQVVAFQAPTAANNYTWYRKYADGWVEQGGYIAKQSSSGLQSVTLPITMRDEFYNFSATAIYSANGGTDHQEATNELSAKTTTGFTKYIWINWTQFVWKIEGMAA